MKTKTPRDYAELDDRELKQIRSLAPTRPRRGLQRLLMLAPVEHLWRQDWFSKFAKNHIPAPCSYCGKLSRGRRLVVNPISLQRSYEDLCGRTKCAEKLRQWERTADARRRRAQYDWEREHPTIAAQALMGDIPPQYPSVSRATLRAFLDLGAEIAVVDGAANERTCQALNGSIRSLGFTDEVYAEIRSGQTVLRRTPHSPKEGNPV